MNCETPVVSKQVAGRISGDKFCQGESPQSVEKGADAQLSICRGAVLDGERVGETSRVLR